MKIDVKFSESTTRFNANFREITEIKDGYSQAEVDKMVADATQEGYDEGYEAGKAEGGDNALQYATQVNRMFNTAAFPDGYEMVVDMPNSPTNISEMFRVSYGLRKLELIVPTDRTYNASYFVYGSATNRSTLEEMVLPDRIKFSNFSNFALRCYALKTVSGSIDLSESTTNENCFSTCSELTELRFVPGTITESLSFNQSAKLSDASIASIVNGLADLTLQTAQSVTLNGEVTGKLTDDQKKEIITKNWDIG